MKMLLNAHLIISKNLFINETKSLYIQRNNIVNVFSMKPENLLEIQDIYKNY